MKNSVNGAVEDGGDLAHFVGEDGEFLGEDGLHSIGKCLVRLVMDLDEEAIRADCHSGAGERKNFVALAGAVTGIYENREVAALFYRGDNREVQSVAGKVGKGADAALA